MARHRDAVLLCGHARATLTAIARELAAAGVPLLVQADAKEESSMQRLCRSLSKVGDAQVVSAELGGDAASRSLVDQAWRQARGFETIVICPALPLDDTAAPTLEDWDGGMSAGLRTPFFLAKHAGQRFGRNGGRVVFAVAGAASGSQGARAHVIGEGLQAMLEALAKALPKAASLTSVIGGRRATAEDLRQVARGVRFFATGERPPSGAALDLGRGRRRG